LVCRNSAFPGRPATRSSGVMKAIWRDSPIVRRRRAKIEPMWIRSHAL